MQTERGQWLGDKWVYRVEVGIRTGVLCHPGGGRTVVQVATLEEDEDGFPLVATMGFWHIPPAPKEAARAE